MSDEERLIELIDAWEQAAVKPAPADLCRDWPQLLPKLQRQIGVINAFAGAPTEAAVFSVDVLSAGDADASAPRIVGPCEIIELIGRGGMGEVYKARHRELDRMVAVKLLKPDRLVPDWVKRFRREVLIHSRLEHDGIATVYDAGSFSTGSRHCPFLVVEYVEGRRLDHYLAESLPTLDARLELMARICEAVGYAHDKDIIHRDLKPSNILVTHDGRPKVIDFGLALAGDADLPAQTVLTETGALVGSIGYMSPEQISGPSAKLDCRSDIYALGVILFEVLCGKPPHDLRGLGVLESIRILRDEEPASLSGINRSLRGDIEIIVARAMVKERDRRYATASELAQDIRRFQQKLPIVARADSQFYRLGRFYARNRRFSQTVVVAFALLTVISIFALVQAARTRRAEGKALLEKQQADQQRSVAFHEREIAQNTSNFLISLLSQAKPEVAHHANMTIREAVDRAAEELDGKFNAGADVRAFYQQMLGDVYSSMGAYDAAIARYEAALRDQNGHDTLDYASCLKALGKAHARMEHFELALVPYQRALAIFKRERGAQDPTTSFIETELATIRGYLGELRDVDVQDVRFKSIGLVFGLTPDEAHKLLTAAGEKVRQAWRAGRQDEAQRIIDVELGRFLAAPVFKPLVPSGLIALAQMREDARDYDFAEPLFEAAVRYAQTIFGPVSLELGEDKVNYGVYLCHRTADTRAEPLLADGVEIMKRIGGDHKKIAYGLNYLALAQENQGKGDSADKTAAEASDRYRRAGSFRGIMDVLMVRCRLLTNLQRFDEAMKLLRDGTDQYRALAAKDREGVFLEGLQQRADALFAKWKSPDKPATLRTLRELQLLPTTRPARTPPPMSSTQRASPF